jgi:hypothetical protein
MYTLTFQDPSRWPDISVVQRKSETSSSSPAAPPKRKRTIAEIFEADRQRREAEAVQEAERVDMNAKYKPHVHNVKVSSSQMTIGKTHVCSIPVSEMLPTFPYAEEVYINL